MPINSGGASRAICSVTAFPQSPPCATNRVYPRRFISTIQARAMRMGSQPVVVGLPENPWPGSDGITTSKASAALAAMGRGIGQRIDDLQLLDDRAGPAVRDDERQRILMFRTNVNEMNVDPIDLGHELRQGVQLRLALAPVVIGRPIAREFLHRRELHALRLIGDGLLSGQRVAAMRRRRSASASSGKLTWKGRTDIAPLGLRGFLLAFCNVLLGRSVSFFLGHRISLSET